MINLSFLPDYQKTALRRARLFLQIHIALGIILFAVTLASAVLVMARAVLINEFNRVKNDTSRVNVEHVRLEANIDELNKKIERAALAQKNFTKWSTLSTRLANLAPGGVTLDYIFINRTTQSVRLNGHARDRDALLALKEALESSSHFKTIEAPLSNLLAKDNIEFRFSGTLAENVFTPQP